jgi:hypothetical protein
MSLHRPTQFRDMPPEIREAIWLLTLPEPGIVVVGDHIYNRSSVFVSVVKRKSNIKVPSALAVNRESRLIYLSNAMCFWQYHPATGNIFMRTEPRDLVEFSPKWNSLAVSQEVWSHVCYRPPLLSTTVKLESPLTYALSQGASVGALEEAEVLCLYDCFWEGFECEEGVNMTMVEMEMHPRCTGMRLHELATLLSTFHSLKRLVIFMFRCPDYDPDSLVTNLDNIPAILNGPQYCCNRSTSDLDYSDNSNKLRASIIAHLSSLRKLDIVPCPCSGPDFRV